MNAIRKSLPSLRRVSPAFSIAKRQANQVLKPVVQMRFLCESHPDFESKKKVQFKSPTEVNAFIKEFVTNNQVALFMKGTPQAPQCGFSLHVVRILFHYGIPFQTINVLENPEIREGVKIYSDWPTIPQLYVKGEFIGGCDIVNTMHQNNELEALFADLQK